jgi:hypothetical protein
MIVLCWGATVETMAEALPASQAWPPRVAKVTRRFRQRWNHHRQRERDHVVHVARGEHFGTDAGRFRGEIKEEGLQGATTLVGGDEEQEEGPPVV